MPPHGDQDRVLPGAERLRDSGPASVPELPVAGAMCQPCEVKAAGLGALVFPSCALGCRQPRWRQGVVGDADTSVEGT